MSSNGNKKGAFGVGFGGGDQLEALEIKKGGLQKHVFKPVIDQEREK